MPLDEPLDDMNTTGFSSTSQPLLSLYTYPERVVVAVFFMLISLLDITGNIMVILAVVFSKKLRTSTNVFVVSLSVADLLTGLAIPMSVVALLSPGDTWPFASEAPCVVAGLLLFIGSGSSLLNLACIALNRAVLIKRPMTSRWLYSKRNLAIMVATVWAVSILTMLIPPLCGVGWFGLDKQHRTCSDIQGHPTGMVFDLIQAAVFYAISLIVIFTSYAVIFIHVRRHFKTQGAHNPEAYTDSANASSTEKSMGETQRSTATREDARRHRIGRQQLQITKNLFVAFCVFLLCTSPYSIAIMLTDDHRFLLFGGVLFLCNSCVNPIIYAAKHPQLKKVMRRMLRCRYSQIEEPSDALKALMACRNKDH